MCVCVCTVLDVVNGFGLLPSGQLNVVVGDDVIIECKANQLVFNAPEFYRVDVVQETQLTSGQGLVITRNT